MDVSKKQQQDCLNHAIYSLPSGGLVLVLDAGETIKPEAVAMLQSLYSRSPKSIFTHLKDVLERGAEKFMQSYYVEYGHKSIGDCATCTIFIEGVSMLVAKAIQDSQLYSGQEVSTRYVDFSTQPFVDPINTIESKKIQDELRAFYLSAKQRLVDHLKEKYPRPQDTKEGIYAKAINARAFDVLRGFLPAGASTSLSWHTNLRQASDHLMRLRNHPLDEVRAVAAAIEDALKKVFPSSFGHKKYPNSEQYIWNAMNNDYYFDADHNILQDQKNCYCFSAFRFEKEILDEYAHLFASRPPKTELPKFVASAGSATFEFMLDFGSYRDLQRHRAINQRMPLLTTKYGFEEWYLDEMPVDLANEARDFLNQIERQILNLKVEPTTSQYYVPMGFLVTHQIRGDLPALIYMLELRSGSTVHPTLQSLARTLARQLQAHFKQTFDLDLNLHIESEPTLFDVRRGKQDIIKKEA